MHLCYDWQNNYTEYSDYELMESSFDPNLETII